MSLIKPSFVESLFHTFFNLDPERPKYYNLVFRLAKNIFMQLGFKNKAEMLDNQIKDRIEEPFKSPLFAILDAYYNPRFFYSKKAYCKIGSGIDTKEITRYEMTVEFEKLKEWCYDEVTQLTPFVRFSNQTNIISA